MDHIYLTSEISRISQQYSVLHQVNYRFKAQFTSYSFPFWIRHNDSHLTRFIRNRFSRFCLSTKKAWAFQTHGTILWSNFQVTIFDVAKKISVIVLKYLFDNTPVQQCCQNHPILLAKQPVFLINRHCWLFHAILTYWFIYSEFFTLFIFLIFYDFIQSFTFF